MAPKIEKLKSWTFFLEYLRNERGDDAECDDYNKELRCEINSDAIMEDGLPLECIVIDDCSDVHLFESKVKAEAFIADENDSGNGVESVWYMDREVEYELKAVIKI